jgi:site-specific recombinase XerC
VNAVRLRVMRLKDKLGLADDVCAYLIRHAFGTNAILNGVDVATVSELMGHASTEITTGVYVHRAEQKSHLQQAVTQAVSTPPAASRDRGNRMRPTSRPGDDTSATPPTPGNRRAAPR